MFIFLYLICAFGVILIFCGHCLIGVYLIGITYMIIKALKIAMTDDRPRSVRIKEKNKKIIAENKKYNEGEHFVYWNMYCNKHNKRR